MMVNLYLDPYLIACPKIESGPDEYENFVCDLLTWKDIVNNKWATPHIAKETTDVLISIGKYPLWDDLAKSNAAFGIQHISPDSIMKIVNSFIKKFLIIEDVLEIEALDYTEFNSSLNSIITRDENLINQVTKGMLVCIVLRCRILNEKNESQIILTNIKESDTFSVGFLLNEILFKNDSTHKYPNKLPYLEQEELRIFNNYNDLCEKKNLEIIGCNIAYKDKKITLSGDHHGNNVLKAFAKKILNSIYLIEVVNNLPFEPKSTKFIKSIHPNGLIDITLTKSDAGYGMTVQSTGRNIYETIEIARLIELEYEHQQ